LQFDLLSLELTRKNRFTFVLLFLSVLPTSVLTLPSYLGTVDIYGTPIVNDFIATGIGEHLVKPLMAKVFLSFHVPRSHAPPLLFRCVQKQPELQTMTRDQAKAFLMECMSILYMRSCAAYSEVYHPLNPSLFSSLPLHPFSAPRSANSSRSATMLTETPPSSTRRRFSLSTPLGAGTAP
jgi:hypothetical protein